MPDLYPPESADSLATLIGLVQRYSPSGAEGPAVDWLVARMLHFGYTKAFVDQAGNAVGVMGAGPHQMILLGHIDTVPGEIPVRTEGDVLFGRGTVDAKGPLAAFVDAVAAVSPLPGWQLVVIGAVDEERDSTGARHAAACYHPEFAIIGEPSRWDRLTLGYKGSAWAEVSLRRALAHTAGQAESACEAAVRVWESVRDWAAAYNAGQALVFAQVNPTLRGLDSGEDGFEAWASLRIGTRLPPGFTPQEWYRQLNQLAAGETVKPLGYPSPAYQAAKNTPLVRAFLAAIRANAGKPGFVLKSGTADLNIVAPAWNCPAVAYGPGDSALDHTPSEHISLIEFRQAVKVLKAAMEHLKSHTAIDTE